MRRVLEALGFFQISTTGAYAQPDSETPIMGDPLVETLAVWQTNILS